MATILGTLVLTAIVVAIDKLVQPLDPRWLAFAYLPVLIVSNLVFLGRSMRRARELRRSAPER